MRKNYIYAIAVVMMTLAIWFGYYLYLEYRTMEYKSGTLVELPKELWQEEKELGA